MELKLQNILDSILLIMNEQQYITIFTILVSAIATVVIAIATWKYTRYSRKNFEELKEQNKFLKKKDKQEYKLERKSICKKLAYEINENEIYLMYLSEFFNSKPDCFPKIWDYFKEKKYKSLFKDNIYKKFIESNIDFKNDEIFENLYFLYSSLRDIQRHMNFVMSKDSTLKPQVLDLFLASILSPIRESLDKIKNLYELFKKETGYDHKESKYYKEKETVIKFLEIQKF